MAGYNQIQLSSYISGRHSIQAGSLKASQLNVVLNLFCDCDFAQNHIAFMNVIRYFMQL